MSLVFQRSSRKPLPQFIHDFTSAAERQGFVIHNRDKMNLADTFSAHGVDVATDFDVHMVQLCKPAKAAASLSHNPERAPLMPKFVVAFTRNDETQIRYFGLDEQLVRELVDDPEFPASLCETQNVIRSLIDEAA
ncbi:MAG: DUF302 domain-containing protein [Desulfuromonas sp.]|nr:MAG: DUF302 domain-containing protein [Desulfuromonas sp.]